MVDPASGGDCQKFTGSAFAGWTTITISVADTPRPDEILVVMAIADGGRLRNRCGTEPIR